MKQTSNLLVEENNVESEQPSRTGNSPIIEQTERGEDTDANQSNKEEPIVDWITAPQ